MTKVLPLRWILLLITLKIDHHQVLNHYKQLLIRYLKMLNLVQHIEVHIYRN